MVSRSYGSNLFFIYDYNGKSIIRNEENRYKLDYQGKSLK
jgi:hypothetical protein